MCLSGTGKETGRVLSCFETSGRGGWSGWIAEAQKADRLPARLAYVEAAI